jgi:hypothetical protein
VVVVVLVMVVVVVVVMGRRGEVGWEAGSRRGE